MHLATATLFFALLGVPLLVQALPIEDAIASPIPVESTNEPLLIIQFSPPDPIFDDVIPKIQKTPQEILRLMITTTKDPISMGDEKEVDTQSDSFAFDLSQGTHAPATLLDSVTTVIHHASMALRKVVSFFSGFVASFSSNPVRTSNHQIYDMLNVDHLSVNENFIDDGRYPQDTAKEEGEYIRSMQEDWRRFEKVMAAFVRAYLPESTE